MSKKINLVSSFNIFQSNTDQLCLIDPVILIVIIIIICLTLYIFEYKLSTEDLK